MKKIILLFIAVSSFCTAQFTKVMDLPTGFGPGLYDQYTEYNIWNNKLFYVIAASDNSLNLNVTDGTAQGTTTILNIPRPAGTNGFSVGSYKKAENGLYFKILTTDSGSGNMYHDLWFTDGTAANTVKVASHSRINIGGLLMAGIDNFDRPYQESHIGNTFYFWKSEQDGLISAPLHLWKSDGTVAGTERVTTASNVYIPNNNDYSDEFWDVGLVYNGNYYFMAQDVSSNLVRDKLYKLNNGVPELVASFSRADRMGTVFKNKMYFIARKPYSQSNWNDDREVYVSDGTTAGTYIFADFPGSGVEMLDHHTFHKNSNYMFLRHNGNGMHNIIATDGTTNFKTLYAGSVHPTQHFKYDEQMAYFTLQSNDTNIRPSFAINLTDFSRTNITKPFYNLVGLEIFNGTLWVPNKAVYNTAFLTPWRSGGSTETTFPATNSPNYASFFFKLNNKLYMFASYLGVLYNALYKFDDDFIFTNTSGDNLWSTPNNWQAKMIPLNFDNATIPANFSPEINGEAFVKSLDVNSPLNISSGNLNINQTLNLGAKVSLNGGNLKLKGTSSNITNGNESNYIVTNANSSVKVESLNSARGQVNIPIGTPNYFNPISIANSGTSDTFSVRVSEGIANTTNGAVNATWEVNEENAGGSNVSLNLGWNTAQHNSSFVLANARVGHYKNGNWVEESSGTLTGTGAYQISATGITDFSPFSVMNFGTLSTLSFSQTKINVFPNPFSDHITISMQDSGTFSLYDMSGNLLFNNLLKKGENTIYNLSVTKGIYVYIIKDSKNKIVKTGKLTN